MGITNGVGPSAPKVAVTTKPVRSAPVTLSVMALAVTVGFGMTLIVSAARNEVTSGGKSNRKILEGIGYLLLVDSIQNEIPYKQAENIRI
jgi:hypothetical protein